MKMTYISVTIFAHFLYDTLNWQKLWGKDFLLNSLYEILKNNVALKQM